MDWDDAYANAAHIPGGAEYPPRWQAKAAEFRALEQAVGRAMLNLPYGEGDRHRYDLFLPAGPARGLVVFVHGGYWLRFGRGDWSHLAAGPLARDWAVAMPSYTLAPAARISQITAEVAQAIAAAAARVAGPIVLTGHSAGGHLVARMPAPDVHLAVAHRVQRIVPISPLTDLREMLKLSMNDDWQLDEDEAVAESPALQPRPDTDVHVWVGGDERPVFLDHARWLADAWSARLTVDPGRHHFDVIDGLEQPESPLTEALLGGL